MEKRADQAAEWRPDDRDGYDDTREKTAQLSNWKVALIVVGMIALAIVLTVIEEMGGPVLFEPS